jgi:tetratricopeptide (TPR) repeat protein
MNVLKRAYLRRGLIYEKEGKYHEALHDLKKVVSVVPDHKKAITAIKRIKANINIESDDEPVSPVPDFVNRDCFDPEEYDRARSAVV